MSKGASTEHRSIKESKESQRSIKRVNRHQQSKLVSKEQTGIKRAN